INGRSGWLTYSASKAAVINMSQVMREELAIYGTRVVCLSPGRTATALRKTLAPDEDPSTIMQPGHVAQVINTMSSPVGRFIDSENVVVRQWAHVPRCERSRTARTERTSKGPAEFRGALRHVGPRAGPVLASGCYFFAAAFFLGARESVNLLYAAHTSSAPPSITSLPSCTHSTRVHMLLIVFSEWLTRNTVPAASRTSSIFAFDFARNAASPV